MIPAQDTKGGFLFQSALTAGNSASGYIDCKGAGAVNIECTFSDIAQPTIASAEGASVAITESDDTHASNFAAVTGATAGSGIKLKRLRRYSILRGPGKKRYVKVTTTAGAAGVSNEAQTVGASATLSMLEKSPTAAADMAGASGNTNDAAVVVP